MKRTRRIELAFAAIAVGLAHLFVLVPEIDLWFADLFYRDSAGFYLRDATWVRFVYEIVGPIVVVLTLSLLIVLLYNLVRRHAAGPFSTRAVLFLMATLALGPGLLVNEVLKNHWGRARPRDIVEFGGTQTFTPAFVVSDQCERNCSFVSGHSSVPFALCSLAFVLRRRRKAIFAGATMFGGLVGLGRIAQGAHFLSDVIFSGILVFLVAYVLAFYVFRLPTVEAFSDS